VPHLEQLKLQAKALLRAYLAGELGWACRYGRAEIVRLLLERGADPVEADAEPWATPRAGAEKMGHRDIAALLADDPST